MIIKIELWKLKKNIYIECGSKTLNSDHNNRGKKSIFGRGNAVRRQLVQPLCESLGNCLVFFAAKQSLLSTAMPEDICRQPQVHPRVIQQE